MGEDGGASSPYELRKYKLAPSPFAHDWRMETEWFPSTEGEFKDKMIDRNMHERFEAASKKIDAVREEMGRSVLKMFRNGEKDARAIDAGEGGDMDYYRARMGFKRGIDFMS